MGFEKNHSQVDYLLFSKTSISIF